MRMITNVIGQRSRGAFLANQPFICAQSGHSQEFQTVFLEFQTVFLALDDGESGHFHRPLNVLNVTRVVAKETNDLTNQKTVIFGATFSFNEDVVRMNPNEWPRTAQQAVAVQGTALGFSL